jgi:predicted  nucleic acid-binding Zn-ribbon protein
MTYVKPSKNHPWNTAISEMVRIAALRKEIAELREQIKAKEAEIARIKSRNKERP